LVSEQSALLDRARSLHRDGRPIAEVIDAFVEAWAAVPQHAEVLYELAGLLNTGKHHLAAYKVICRAAAIPANEAERYDVPADVYRWRIDDLRSMLAHRLGFHDEAVALCDKLLASPHLPHAQRDRILSNRNFSLEHVAKQRRQHNPHLVQQITKHLQHPNPEPRLTLTITTCKRRSLFERTIDSFLHCCQDRLTIDRWICIDDGSTPEDLEAMRTRYPFFEYITKPPHERGHANSMNRLLHDVTTPYWLHLEDDWDFLTIGNFLQQATHVLDHDPTLLQVVLNRNWMVSPWPLLVGGVVKRTDTGFPYREHVYLPRNSAGFKQLLADNPGARTAAHWPGFSLNPSVIRTQAARSIGAFHPATGFFEREYALRARSLGWNTAFLDTINDVTSGPTPTDAPELQAANAYGLNGMEQFQTFPETTVAVRVSGSDGLTDPVSLRARIARQFPTDGRWRGVRIHQPESDPPEPDYWLVIDPVGAEPHITGRTIVVDAREVAGLLLWDLGATYDDLRVRPISKSRTLSLAPGVDGIAAAQRDDALIVALRARSVEVDDEREALEPHDHRTALLPYRYTVLTGRPDSSDGLSSLLVDAILSECLAFSVDHLLHLDLSESDAVIRLPSDDPDRAAALIADAVANNEHDRRLPAIRREKRRILDEFQFAPTLARLVEHRRQHLTEVPPPGGLQ